MLSKEKLTKIKKNTILFIGLIVLSVVVLMIVCWNSKYTSKKSNFIGESFTETITNYDEELSLYKSLSLSDQEKYLDMSKDDKLINYSFTL